MSRKDDETNTQPPSEINKWLFLYIKPFDIVLHDKTKNPSNGHNNGNLLSLKFKKIAAARNRNRLKAKAIPIPIPAF